MNSKAWLIVCSFLIWSIGSGWFYTCKIKQVCTSSTASQLDSFAVGFKLNETEPIVSTKLGPLLDSLKSRSNEGNILEIVGLFTAQEQITDLSNLGLVRANKFINLYRDSLAEMEFRSSSEVIELDSSIEYFSGLKFKWFTKNEKLDEGENTAILYLDKTDLNDLNPKIKAYLTLLSIERKDDVIDLIGHCYSEDSSTANYTGGLVLANFVRNKLVAKGFNEYQVNASSKGDSIPLNSVDSVTRIEVLINN